jgi:hypothetical protein
MADLQTAGRSASAELAPIDTAIYATLQSDFDDWQAADASILECAAGDAELPDIAGLWARHVADSKTANSRVKVLTPKEPRASVATESEAAADDALRNADGTLLRDA